MGSRLPIFLQSQLSTLQSSPLHIALLVATGLLLAAAPLSLAVLSVAGIAFVILLLIRPVLGLWMLPFAVPFGSIRGLPLAGYNVGATEILIGLTLIVWLARGLAHRSLKIEVPPLLIPLVLLLGAMLLSATDVYALVPAAKELVKWIEILLVYGLAFNLIENRREALILTGALLAGGSLSALHGVVGSLMRVGPPQFAILGGRLYRAFGTFGQPNPFGGYMNHSLPVAFSLLVASLVAYAGRESKLLQAEEADGTESRPISSPSFATLPRLALARLLPSIRVPRLLGVTALLVTSVVLTLGLGLSWSRGAWLGAAAGLVTVALAWLAVLLTSKATDPSSQALRRRAVAFLWLSIAVVVIIAMLGGLNLLPASITIRIDSAVATFTTLDARGANITDANFATLERVAHWQAAWDMWRDNFWTGVGIGNYAAAYPEYGLAKWPYALGHAHNIYFNMAAETGLIGLLAYLAVVGAAVLHTWQSVRRSSEVAVRGVAIGVLGVLVALAVHNFFDNMYVHAMGVHLALALGLVSILDRRLPVVH